VDTKIVEEFLDELFSSLEAVETRSAAVLQFLKEQAEVTDEELAPYMEQASKASNVRWRAARLRMMSLFSSAAKSAEESSTKGAAKAEPQTVKPKAAEPAEENASKEDSKKPPNEARQPKVQAADKERPTEADSEKDGGEPPAAKQPDESGKKDAA